MALTPAAKGKWRAAQSLPLEGHLPDVIEGLEQNRSVLITAPPGTGKTVLVPLAIAANRRKLRVSVVMVVIPQRATVIGQAAYISDLIEDYRHSRFIDTVFSANDADVSSGATGRFMLFCTPEALSLIHI